MRNFLNPRWIFVFNTLPVIILSLIYYFNTAFWGNLAEGNLDTYTTMVFALSIFTLANAFYASIAIVQKKQVSLIWAACCFVTYCIFIFTYIYVQQITYYTDLYPYSFLMPTVLYSFLALVFNSNLGLIDKKVYLNFVLALLVPIVLYFVVMGLVPLFRDFSYEVRDSLSIIAIVIGVVIFVFFILHGLFLIFQKRKSRIPLLVWKILFGIIFPLIGFCLNNGVFGALGGNVFGDFSSKWFYIIAAINGIVLCLPKTDNKIYRTFLFITKSICYSYVIYFFLIFAPYLPLAVVIILYFGAGLVILTPVILAIIQLIDLKNDLVYLKQYYNFNMLVTAMLISFFIIPALVIAYMYRCKEDVTNAIDYVYNANYAKTYKPVNADRLEYSIEMINSNYGSRRMFSSDAIPFISPLFSKIVFENKKLSYEKENHLIDIFRDSEPVKPIETIEVIQGVYETPPPPPPLVQFVPAIKTETSYDTLQQVWKTWVNMDIKYYGSRLGEYQTSFELPDGCFISNYYLYVGADKEFGMLTEKKSAMWIYNKIVSSQRDPGILYYANGKVNFNVFPFVEGEVRQTGIEFIHKEPATIVIDNTTVELGIKNNSLNTSAESGRALYIPAEVKEQLPLIERKPYHKLIIDASKTSEGQTSAIASIVSKYAKDNIPVKFAFCNSYVSDDYEFTTEDEFAKLLERQTFKGGFYIERAIRKTLYNSFVTGGNTYPLITVISLNNDVVSTNDYSDMGFTYPDYMSYHLDDGANKRTVHYGYNLKTESKHVRVWTDGKDTLYLANNNQPDIALKTIGDINTVNDPNQWNTALAMRGEEFINVLQPFKASQRWLPLVKQSFASKIMNIYTSYIVVETDAQREELLKKEEKMLAGELNDDAVEASEMRSSEPELLIMLLLLGVVIFINRKHIKKANN